MSASSLASAQVLVILFLGPPPPVFCGGFDVEVYILYIIYIYIMCGGVRIYNVRALPLCSRYRLDFIFLRRRCLLPPLLRASSRHFISPASAPRFLCGHPRVKYRRMSIIVRIWQPTAATAPVLCGGPCYRSCSAHVYGTADVPSFIRAKRVSN